MAQAGYTPILLYSSSTASQAPAAGNLTNSALGSELAINITDGKLFYKDNANNIQVIGWKVVPTTAGGTGLTAYTAGDLLYYTSGTTLTQLAIGASGRYLASSGTAPQWNAPAALTKTDDTNVTLTLGGNASTALLNAASLTLGWTGQLAVTRGGTGLATVAQGDILYGSASNTLAALAKNTTATRYLANTGTNNNPAWAQIDLTNGVTGTLPVGNGGTGATTFTAGRILFGNSTSAINTSANLFWDNANSRLGLGSASPNTRLMVVGNGSSVELFHDVCSIRFASSPNRTNSWYMGANISDGVDGGFYIGQGANITTGTPRLEIDFAGNAKVNSGNLVIGTSGKGIDFSATAGTGTSELFADYEEGTWTPGTIAYGPGGTLPTFTGFAASGKYTKIGRQVFVTGVISWTGRTGGAVFFAIDNLPFAVDPHTMQGTMEFDENFQASLGVSEAIWDAGLKPRTFQNSAIARFKFGYASAGGTNVVLDLDCTSLLNTTANLRFALNYIV